METMANGARFMSKKNTVYYRYGVVIKIFADQKSADAEAEILREYHSAGVGVPRVLACHNNEIDMEYIHGETLPRFLERMSSMPDEDESRVVAGRLCDWFEGFYKAVGYPRGKTGYGEIRGDVNGRNFIIAPDRVVSVDFEQRAYGSAERDIGRLLAYISTYDLPDDRARLLFARTVHDLAIERLGLSADEVLRQRELELAAMDERRKK